MIHVTALLNDPVGMLFFLKSIMSAYPVTFASLWVIVNMSMDRMMEVRYGSKWYENEALLQYSSLPRFVFRMQRIITTLFLARLVLWVFGYTIFTRFEKYIFFGMLAMCGIGTACAFMSVMYRHLKLSLNNLLYKK